MSNPLFKVDPKYLHPIESFVYITLNKYVHYLRPYNITPNQLTTFNIIASILSAYYLHNNKKLLAIIFFIISYIFDCADGLYARKYKMVSKFGDYYDHISDFVQYLLYVYILFGKYNLGNYKIVIVTLLLYLILHISYLGCMEKIYAPKSNDTLSFSKRFCFFNNHKEGVNKLKYFGSPTGLLLVCFIILYIH